MIQQFKTIEELNQYLKILSKPKWLKGLVVHHTYTPQVYQWRGMKTMLGMLRYYNAMGWNAYPHFFIAPDGIWTMNDLSTVGIHSNLANSYTYGIEVVGRYDTQFWQEPIRTFALETIATLIQWGKLSVHTIYPHRQFNPAKSCPGNAVSIPYVKQLVNDILLRPKIIPAKQYRVIVDVARVRQGPSTAYAIAGTLNRGDIFYSIALKQDEKGVKNIYKQIYTWAHITQCTNNSGILDNVGFVRTDLVEEII
jgi:hypothetical protein